MNYQGDYRAGDTLSFAFTTVTTTGAPTQLAGTPAIRCYKNATATQDDSGITLAVDFHSITGLNMVTIDTSADGTFYADGADFTVIISTGTVGGVSVVGYVVASFSLSHRSALRPTVAARTLDVSSAGEAGVDWANVGSPTTAVNLSATNIDVDQVVASVSGAVGSVTGAVGSVTGAVGSVTGNVGGNVAGSVASVTARVTANTDQLAGETVTAAAGVTFPTSVASPTNITAGTITTVTNLTNAPTAGDLTATMKTSVQTAAAAAVTGAEPIDANVTQINGTTVNGDGAGSPWGP